MPSSKGTEREEHTWRVCSVHRRKILDLFDIDDRADSGL